MVALGHGPPDPGVDGAGDGDGRRGVRLPVLARRRGGGEPSSRHRGLRAAQPGRAFLGFRADRRSEEHTSEPQSLMRISYAVFCLKKKKNETNTALTQYVFKL